MPPVTVLVLTPALAPDAGPLGRLLASGREALAGRLGEAFLGAGAASVAIHREPPDDTPFGARLRRLVASARPAGLVVLGAGSIPLATRADLRLLVAAAGAAFPRALANRWSSADVIAIACATEALRDLPDLPGDNSLPRWLTEVAGIPVRDLGGRRRLAVDVDSPLDLLLSATGRGRGLPLPGTALAGRVTDRLAALRALADDPGAELLVAGRMSGDDVRWLERGTRGRTRLLVEERGLRTATAGALLGRPNRRPPGSVLGLLLDRDGPERLGRLLPALGDGALIDSRVLLAHRLGPDERRWPPAEDRFASDLLRPELVHDPWLAALTASALEAPIPVLLGGHTLVGPGARLALRRVGPRATGHG
jgi:CTP:molybdopterin cytidylyltransferase MocA